MNTFKRRGNKWTVTELLQLQREHELLEWTVQQIAEKHQRSVDAILYRLEDEGFINSWSEARGYQMESDANSDIVANVEIELGGDDNDSEYNCHDNSSISKDVGDDNTITSSDRLNERVDAIEETLASIKEMLATILANSQQKNSNLNIYNTDPDRGVIYKTW